MWIAGGLWDSVGSVLRTLCVPSEYPLGFVEMNFKIHVPNIPSTQYMKVVINLCSTR